MNAVSKRIPVTLTEGEQLSLLAQPNPRYHYLEFPTEVPVTNSIVDFKHYFSVTVEYLKRVKQDGYVCNIAPVYREDLGQRFASFLSRIGVPEKKREAS